MCLHLNYKAGSCQIKLGTTLYDSHFTKLVSVNIHSPFENMELYAQSLSLELASTEQQLGRESKSLEIYGGSYKPFFLPRSLDKWRDMFGFLGLKEPGTQRNYAATL